MDKIKLFFAILVITSIVWVFVSLFVPAEPDKARRGVIPAKRAKSSKQSTKDVTIEELDKLLESKRKKEEPVKDEYRRISVQDVKTYKGRWVKILLKDGLKQEGEIVDVNEEVIQLQQSFTAGSFSTKVPIQKIEDIHLLVVDSRSSTAQ